MCKTLITLFCSNTSSTMKLKISVIMRFQCSSKGKLSLKRTHNIESLTIFHLPSLSWLHPTFSYISFVTIHSSTPRYLWVPTKPPPKASDQLLSPNQKRPSSFFSLLGFYQLSTVNKSAELHWCAWHFADCISNIMLHWRWQNSRWLGLGMAGPLEGICAVVV